VLSSTAGRRTPAAAVSPLRQGHLELRCATRGNDLGNLRNSGTANLRVEVFLDRSLGLRLVRLIRDGRGGLGPEYGGSRRPLDLIYSVVARRAKRRFDETAVARLLGKVSSMSSLNACGHAVRDCLGSLRLNRVASPSCCKCQGQERGPPTARRTVLLTSSSQS
jgi:hypothetical protein